MDSYQRTTVSRILEPGTPGVEDTAAVELEWDRPCLSGTLYLDTWHARLRSPRLSITFGQVGKTADGKWYVSIFPAGRGEKPSFYARYNSRARAIQQLERWTRSNWRRIPAQPLSHGWGSPKITPPRDSCRTMPWFSASIDELGTWIAHHG